MEIRTKRAMLLIGAFGIASAAWLATGAGMAAERLSPPKSTLERSPLPLPKTAPAAPHAITKPILSPPLKTINIFLPLKAEGGRNASNGSVYPLKSVTVQATLAATGGREPASNVPVPMKTLNVYTPLKATGPR